MFPRAFLSALLVAVLVLGACRKEEVVSYRVPKEKDSAAPTADAPEAAAPAAVNPPASTNGTMGGGMAGMPVPTADGSGLTWTAPATWKLKPPAPMRKATYAVPGDGGEAELSITAFPNSVGGETANLNRWRGQVKLPPLEETELVPQIVRLTANGLSFAVADFSNGQAPAAGPQHILGAIVPVEGATWFFKLSGPDALVAKEKPAFLEFLKTVKPASPDTPAAP